MGQINLKFNPRDDNQIYSMFQDWIKLIETQKNKNREKKLKRILNESTETDKKD